MIQGTLQCDRLCRWKNKKQVYYFAMVALDLGESSKLLWACTPQGSTSFNYCAATPPYSHDPMHIKANNKVPSACFSSMKAFILVLLCSAFVAAVPVDLQINYQFSLVLFDQGDQYYGLHWSFDRSTEAIYFAVNVSSTGWVGFGLSPNGQMPGSDVVIGWVSNSGEAYFHVSVLTEMWCRFQKDSIWLGGGRERCRPFLCCYARCQ